MEIKHILRRFLALCLTAALILTFMPPIELTVYAATSGTVTGLSDESIGLSFSGTADDAWTANGTAITGSVVSTGGTCSDTSYNSTLTITNKKIKEATLSFNYEIEQNSGTITVDGTAVTANESFSKEVAAGKEIKVYIESGSTTATKITITNIKLVANTTATTIFQPAENGDYTVDGEAVTAEYSKTQSSQTAYQLEATPADGYKFFGWYNVTTEKYINTDKTTTINVERNCTITAKFVAKDVAIFETGGQPFDDLNEAVWYAQANKQDKITLTSDGSISGNYTIPTGITLLIPFDAAGTLYKETPAYTTKTEEQGAFKTLTMKDGACINVDGAISVGGKHYTSSSQECCKTTGSYGLIRMEGRSSITLKDGSNLYAWGYIVGDGNITANSGAKVYEYFQVTDWRGGSATLDMKGNEQKVFPFSQYYVQNIESNLTINSGASEYTYISVTASFVGTKSATIPFIGADSLFSLKNDSTFTKKYIPSDDRVTFEISGDADLNSIAIDVAGVAVDSKDYVLPINNNVDINVKSGTTTITKDVALLPGTHTSIAENAELKVASGASLYIYDDSEWSRTYVWGSNSNGFKPVAYSPSNKSERTIADARVDVCGKLTAEGSIYTTKTGADICSSTGKGEYSQLKNSGTGKVTYQYDQSNKKYIEIPITPANLHNADGTYTESPNVAETITYKDGRWQHRYGEWSVTKAATCSKVGSKERSCEVCGAKETSEIAIDANAHTWESNLTIDKAASCTEKGVVSSCCGVFLLTNSNVF